MVKLLSISSVFILASFSHNAISEEYEDDLLMMLSGDEEMISIATGTPRPISKAPAVASVITAADIISSGANTLAEILENIPGLHAVTSVAKHQSPTYSFRGINTELGAQTLFLINGVEMTFLMAGGLTVGLELSLNNIARIEVIRGPGSTVYGADAFAGVINVITKSNQDIPRNQVGAKFGSFTSQSIWGQYQTTINDWQLAANIEYKQTKGDSGRIIESDLQTILDSILSTSASIAPGPLDTAYQYLVTNFKLRKNQWTVNFNSWNGESGLGAGIANALDSAGIPLKTDQYLLDISYQYKDWLPNWSLTTRLSHLYLDLSGSVNIFPNNALLPIGADGNLDFVAPVGLVTFPDGYIGKPGRVENTTHFEVTTLFDGWKNQTWRLNVGAKNEGFKSSERKNFGPGVINGTISPIDGTLTDVTDTEYVYIPNQSRTVSFISAQDEWMFAPDWQFIAGVRYDNYSDFGGTTNPRASLIWSTRHDLTTKLLYGRAFRAPSFAELYAQNNPVATGNRQLKPETINTLELAFDYKPNEKLSLIFNIFKYNIKGLVEFVDDDGIPGGDATAQNAINQQATGYELEATWVLNKYFKIFASSAYHNAENSDTGDPIANTPQKQFHLGFNWMHSDQWSSQLNAFRIMDRYRAQGDPRPAIDDYNWINWTINGIDLFDNIGFQFAVKNLLDTDAKEPGPAAIINDYPLEGRSIHFGISTTF